MKKKPLTKEKFKEAVTKATEWEDHTGSRGAFQLTYSKYLAMRKEFSKKGVEAVCPMSVKHKTILTMGRCDVTLDGKTGETLEMSIVGDTEGRCEKCKDTAWSEYEFIMFEEMIY